MSAIAVSGRARYQGVPAATITWDTTFTATIFGSITKTMMCDQSQTTGNDGEVDQMRIRNNRIQIQCQAYPIGATAAAALAVAENVPDKDQEVTVACASDSQIATPASGTSLVESWSVEYTPEGEAVINATIVNWIAKDFVTLAAS